MSKRLCRVPTRRALISRSVRWAALSAIALLASACAVSPGPYTQKIDLGKDGAVAIDVKQRVVFSHLIPMDFGQPEKGSVVVTCAEPSPDALTVMGASAATSFSIGSPAAPQVLNLAGSSSEAGAFTGLRTQSIQLLRDQMYRLCEAYAAGAMNDGEFRAMQRRFQTTVLGLLAIEQLTGPVVAGQALLTSSAQSQAGAGAGDAQVVAARGTLDTKDAELLEAEKAVIDKLEAVRSADAELAVLSRDIVAAEKDGAPAETVAPLKQRQQELSTQRKADNTALLKAEKDRESKRRAVADAKQQLHEAQSRASSSSDTRGELRTALVASQQSTESLSRAVVDIVNNVAAAYTRDGCLELLARLANSPGITNLSSIDVKLAQSGPLQQTALNALATVRTTCSDVIGNDSAERRAEAELRLQQARLKTAEVMLELERTKKSGGKTDAPARAKVARAPSTGNKPAPAGTPPTQKPAPAGPSEVKPAAPTAPAPDKPASAGGQ